MSIKVFKAGIADSVQDIGRYGHQHLGVNPTGAMDKLSMQVANILAGNKRNEAVLELHFPASTFIFNQPALIALAGADFNATINGDKIPHLHSIWIAKNDVLQFHKPINGTRAYLSINGGISINEWLGSKSTNRLASAGGFKGRLLQKGDEVLLNKSISLRKDPGGYKIFSWFAEDCLKNMDDNFFIIPGNEWNELSDDCQCLFVETKFHVGLQSDRMAIRLNENLIPIKNKKEITSSAVSFGTIQFLPNGQLLILAADHQTTGGYPRVGNIISAHHHKLAQLKPGNSLRFTVCSVADAEELLVEQEKHLRQLQNAITFKLNEIIL